MHDHFKDGNVMQDVLRQAQTGLWVIEMEEGKAPRMYADSAMRELLGVDTIMDPEECYRLWYDRIVDEYYPVVLTGVRKISNDERAEVQYAWEHPKWGRIYVRCGGVRDWDFKDGICLRGYHQNITNTVILRQEYDAIIQTLSQGYYSILLGNLQDHSFRTIKVSEKYKSLVSGFTHYEDFMRFYVNNEVAIPYRERVLQMTKTEVLQTHMSEGDRQIEVFYRNIYNRWQRMRIVPANGYSDDYPWVIIAFDEQEGEMERRLNDASAKAAVAQMYTLVLSVDLARTEYNLIHYSGNLLHLSERGSYAAFYQQTIQRMPSEDRAEMDVIFDRNTYIDQNYREGTLRLYDNERRLHYYTYYSTQIRHGIAECILMTVRNVDDKHEAQLRDNALSNLCQCYYSIYLFDLEKGVEEAIWQEAEVRSKYPCGSLKVYYEKFIQEYVYEEDQEKMLRAGTPEFLQQTLSLENPVYDIDFRRVYPDGLKWIRSRFSIAEIRDNTVTKVVFANMNINDQKIEELKQEAQNRQALLAAYEAAKNADEAKSSFLAQMSHDIRTPMNAIMGMLSIAYNCVDDPKKVCDCLGKMEVSSRHLLSLINKILDMSKIEKGKIDLSEAPFEMHELLTGLIEMVRPQAAAKKQQLTFDIGELNHSRLLGDAARIRQVLLNLLSNAVKYTPENGHIYLRAQEVSGHMDGYCSFAFSVEDDGIGMSKEFIEQVFVPFSRAEDPVVQNVQGTGLGMSIAQGIVAAMRGNIQVESELGKGSRFVVTLNLKALDEDLVNLDYGAVEGTGYTESDAAENIRFVEDLRTVAELHKEDQCQAKGTLLLVEDNELNMEIACTLLRQSGYVVHTAANGLDALNMFRESQPGIYDAILMDLQMPVMDGCHAAREIRSCGHAQSEQIPIIALTANAFAEDITKALAAGMNDHISKPIDFPRLIAVLDKYIKSSALFK